MSKKDKRRTTVALQTPRYHLINWLLLLSGVASIGFGFWFLWRGSVTLAPILMVIGYCVIVPIALIMRFRKPKPKEKTNV